MSSVPFTSKVELNQALLVDIQKSFLQLPPEYQNLASIEIQRVANRLRGWLEDGNKQHEHNVSTYFDIHAEATYPQKIQESERWLGFALEQSHSGAWRWDLVKGTIQWSPELYYLFGRDPVQETTDPQIFFEMIHPDDRESTSNKMNEAIKRGGPFSLEFRILRGDGSTIWLSSAGTVEYDPSGRPIQAAGINQDITARKLTEQALRKSLAREQARAAELQALMDAVPAMIWISRDPQCKEMIGNRYGYEFLTMWEGANVSKTAPDQDLVQQPYRNVKDSQEIPSNELPMQIAASTGVGTSNYEFDVVFIDGETRNLLGNVLPLTDENGKPGGAVGAFIDITARKRMEDELRRNESQLKRWKEYLDFWNKATSSFFWVLDADGSYHDPISSSLVISGKSFDETRGWNWLNIIHPEDREQSRSEWQNAIEQRRDFEIESRVWHEASQQYHWFSHRAVPIVEEGTLKGWIGASIDIQQHKEAELALRESEHRFRIALASAPMTVFTTDKELRYTWIYNPQRNFTVEQMVGKRDDEILLAENVVELIQLKQSVMETGQPVRQEIKVKANDTWLYFVVSFDPILDSSGRVTGLICAAFDITTQRQLEVIQRENEICMATQQRLLETRENERTNIAREVHDGPLQTLMAMNFEIHNLKESITDEALRVELELVQVSLKTAARELRQVVNELRPPALSRIGLLQALQEQLEEIRKKYPELDLTADMDEAINDLSDPLSLAVYRICQESLHNILHHSHATEVVIHLSQIKDQIVLVVQDNGIGFSVPNDFTKLTADKHYGLAGMRERAEAMGGSLEVYSKPSEGTEIKVCFPK
jgi:PAS domain S-box-containing protein